MRLPKIDNGITITHKKTTNFGVVSHLKSPSEFIFDALTQRHAKNLSAQLANLGLLKKPDRLQRNLFQRSKPVKLAAYRAIDDCYNC